MNGLTGKIVVLTLKPQLAGKTTSEGKQQRLSNGTAKKPKISHGERQLNDD